jgi:Arylsulfotransferase (ASST)
MPRTQKLLISMLLDMLAVGFLHTILAASLLMPGIVGDLHELLITPDDHALVTIYTPKQADLTEFGGASDGWIFENVFQEINIDTSVSNGG